MTIVHQFLKKDSTQQEEPLVPCEKYPTTKDVEEGKPVVVTMHAHVRRVSSMTSICVCITALLVCATGIIGGVYLYKQFSQYKLRHYHGWCSIPYGADIQVPPKSEAMTGAVTEKWEVPKTPRNNFFEEEFDIDIKFEKFEKIAVPQFSHGRRAQFLNDFVKNKTAIADIENRRCFVMALNRNFVLPPRHLYELVSKMRAGYFNADTQVVRQSMRVVTPRLTDYRNIGVVITHNCANMPIYMLERITSPVFKRSLEEDSKNLFVFFSGHKITEYNIMNLHDTDSEDKP